MGSITRNYGQNVNQYRRLLNGRLSHVHEGDLWRFDWTASYSENRRTFSDVDEGFFAVLNTTLTNLVLSAENLDNINVARPPDLTARSRTGVLLDHFDPGIYTMNNATSGRMYFKNRVGQFSANAARRFDTRLPLTLKAGVAVENTRRENWTQSLSWAFNPPAAAGGNLVANRDLQAEAYNARRDLPGVGRIGALSTAKLYQLYQANPTWFVLNEVAAHTNLVNSTRQLEETLTSAYLRGDLKAFDNRLWLVTGVRMEHTADEGRGPLNDITATYQRNASGAIVLGSNGRPVPIAGDALSLARLRYTALGASSKKSYQDYFPSLNASYTFAEHFVLRAGYASTIGRPDLSFIIPGTSISDPTVAAPTVTVVNTGLKPWTAQNYDLTAESYDFRGATLSASGFRKDITDFFTTVRVPATAGLLEQFGLPAELLDGNYEVVTRENSPLPATITGVEGSWRQSLRPFTGLPGWARSFGWFINQTQLRLSGPGANQFSGYSTRITNWGLSYARPRFALKMNVTQSNGPRNATVAANATTPAGTYSGLEPRTLVGGSVEYRFRPRLTLHFSGQNLSNAYYRSLTFSPGAPEYTRPTQSRNNGIEYVLGLKGEF